MTQEAGHSFFIYVCEQEVIATSMDHNITGQGDLNRDHPNQEDITREKNISEVPGSNENEAASGKSTDREFVQGSLDPQDPTAEKPYQGSLDPQEPSSEDAYQGSLDPQGASAGTRKQGSLNPQKAVQGSLDPQSAPDRKNVQGSLGWVGEQQERLLLQALQPVRLLLQEREPELNQKAQSLRHRTRQNPLLKQQNRVKPLRESGTVLQVISAAGIMRLLRKFRAEFQGMP